MDPAYRTSRIAGLFPEGRIGDLARIVAEHTLSARRRTPRLAFPADESPFSVKWCGKVLRKLGHRISNEDLGFVRDLLRDTFEAGRNTAWSAPREPDATEVVRSVEEFLADLRPNPPPLWDVDDLIATWADGL